MAWASEPAPKPEVLSAQGPVQLVIFDCDGVLVDSEPISARIGAAMLTRNGWPLDPQAVLDRFLGCSDEYYRAEVEAHTGRQLDAAWHAEADALLDAAFVTELRAVEGVADVLDALDAAAVATCVASNGGHGKLRRTLGATGLAERFPGRVFSAADVPRAKPAPDLYLHAARSMDAAPQDCIVVEDSPRGVTAARAAGMPVLGYTALTPADRLAGPGVTICPTMADVLVALLPLLPIRK